MAKVRSPLFSLEAFGSVGHGVTFRRTPSVPSALRRTAPPQPNTPAQQAARLIYKQEVQHWNTPLLTPLDRTAWNRLARLPGGAKSPVAEIIKLYYPTHQPHSVHSDIYNASLVLSTPTTITGTYHSTFTPYSPRVMVYGTSPTYLPHFAYYLAAGNGPFNFIEFISSPGQYYAFFLTSRPPGFPERSGLYVTTLP